MTVRRRRAKGVGRALEEVHEGAVDRILRASFWATDALGAYVERANAAVRLAPLETIGPFGRDRRKTPRR